MMQEGESLPADTYRLAVYALYETYSMEPGAANKEVPHDLRVSEPFEFGPIGARQ